MQHHGALDLCAVIQFQSSPGQKAGCNFRIRSRSRSACTFQSSPGQKAGCNERNSGRRQPFRCFNPHPASSPGQKAGCNRRRKIEVGRSNIVSILTRPEGRVQRRRAHRRTIRPQSFNPHPARRPGATLNFSNATVNSGVSILTRPEGRVQPATCRSRWPGDAHHLVSILTRPEGRVQHGEVVIDVVAARGFNPHPARRPGATTTPPPPPFRVVLQSFQSSPGQKAGCNASKWVMPVELRDQLVSILTRPEGRVQP